MPNGTITDERNVLAVCLNELYLGDKQVVRASTRSGLPPIKERTLAHLRETLVGLDEETLADFLAKNREPHPVEPDLNPNGRLVCVEDEAFHLIFRDGEGWARFRRKFPDSDGTLRFSRVGLNGGITQAMLYAGQQFDWNVGSGGFLLFTRSDGAWIEVARSGTWIS